MLLLWMGMAHAGCDQLLTVSLNQAERAFVTEQVPVLEEALRDARKALACVDAPLTPTQSARMHRAEGLLAHLRGNRARTHDLLRAMIRSDPWLGLGVLVDGDHPLTRQAIAAEELEPSRTFDIAWPQTGAVHVDGLAANRAPAAHPWIHQHLTEDGRVVATSWVEAGHDAPSLDVRRRGRGLGWTLAGVGTGLAAGALYGAAWSQRARYEQAVDAQDDAAARQLHGATNALSIAAVAAGGSGATLLVIGVTR